MRTRSSQSAFTLVEFLMAAGVFGSITVALVLFTSTSMRLIIRNLATNHSHDTMRISSQRLLADLHDAASRFVLIDFNGTTYSDVSYSRTTDVDPLSGKYISTRAKGVRFYEVAGGPFKLAGADTITPATRNLPFNFSVGGALPYIPQEGDRLVLPLLAREFKISRVITPPTVGSPVGTVEINELEGVGFTIYVGTGYNTTAYFYRMAAYTVHNQELRYHANFEGANKANFIMVRRDVTSPKPFGLLYATSTSPTSTQLDLRVSLETADTQYSARNLLGSTTTLQAVIPPRNLPPQIANTQ